MMKTSILPASQPGGRFVKNRQFPEKEEEEEEEEEGVGSGFQFQSICYL